MISSHQEHHHHSEEVWPSHNPSPRPQHLLTQAGRFPDIFPIFVAHGLPPVQLRHQRAAQPRQVRAAYLQVLDRVLWRG